MSAGFSFSGSFIIALFFLLSGAARPLCTIISCFTPKTEAFEKIASECGDGEEEDSTQDDDADPEFKIVANAFILNDTLAEDNEHFTVCQHIFQEHHPELITPPPKA